MIVAMFSAEKLVDEDGLSKALLIPADWLRREAVDGRIPCLKIGKRLRFNVDAVKRSLATRAANEWCAVKAVANA